MSSQGEIRDGDGAGFGLIETLRWEPRSGFVRLERHLARLAGSARALGFAWSAADGMAELGRAAHGDAPLRVRLELARNGTVTVTTRPFHPVPPGTVWTVCISQHRLSSTDPLIRHKVGRRPVHDAARAEFSAAEADEVLLLNERGEPCEGTITNLFVDPGDGGPLRTPAAMCGLLPGVLRAELLATGRAVEAVLDRAELGRDRLLVGNSLRGLVTAELGRRGAHARPEL